MKKETIVKNDSIGYWLDYLKEKNYKYIVKANDKFLSGLGLAENKKHIQLFCFKTYDEAMQCIHILCGDSTYNYVNWYNINERKNIYNCIRNKSYTIRNDWTQTD